MENRIGSLLYEKQVNQKTLAEKLEITQNTVNSWCKNKTQPSLLQGFQIASVLGVSINELIKE
jgi:DNA-binding XRE family transcriptional regulator